MWVNENLWRNGRCTLYLKLHENAEKLMAQPYCPYVVEIGEDG